MFHSKTNASKAVFLSLIQFCKVLDIKVIDCQFHTSHPESLGGEYIYRKEYLEYLRTKGSYVAQTISSYYICCVQSIQNQALF
jgi:Leu/Phe-tRNA-protein transferase